jgi:hypothetical protein
VGSFAREMGAGIPLASTTVFRVRSGCVWTTEKL